MATLKKTDQATRLRFAAWARDRWAAMSLEERAEAEARAKEQITDCWCDDIQVEEWSLAELRDQWGVPAGQLLLIGDVPGKRSAPQWEREYGVPIPAIMRELVFAGDERAMVVLGLWYSWNDEQVRSATALTGEELDIEMFARFDQIVSGDLFGDVTEEIKGGDWNFVLR